MPGDAPEAAGRHWTAVPAAEKPVAVVERGVLGTTGMGTPV
jgi:hypothetical protein